MGELSVRELPLFPLPEVVLFPQEVLPLHIFESRYRIMLQSVLETDSMFGVINWDPNTKTMANVGCCAQIIKHQTAEDGIRDIRPSRGLGDVYKRQRYRIMLQSVLESDSMFGVIKWDPNTKSMANVGCCTCLLYTSDAADE